MFCFVYITPKSPAKTEQGILQHCLKMKNQAFPSRMTHIVSEMFWVASQFRTDTDIPPCNNHRSVCWAPSCRRPWVGADRGPWHAALWWVSARCQPQVLPWPPFKYQGTASQKGRRSQPRSQTEQAEPGPFDPRACSGFHLLLVTLCLDAMDRPRHGLLLVFMPPPSPRVRMARMVCLVIHPHTLCEKHLANTSRYM